MTDSSKSVFSQFIAENSKKEERPAPEIAPAANLRTGRLLHWLLNYWTKPTISTRDIYVYGPHATRDRKTAIDMAESLAQQGWLLPLRAHRLDRKVWLLIRETGLRSAPHAPATQTKPQPS